MTCLWCSTPLPPYCGRGRPRKFCSKACGLAWHGAWRPQKSYEARVCDDCGAEFEPHRVDQRFCDDECGHRFHRRKSQQPWNDRRRANYQKRRALKRAAPAAGVVLLAEIRERDGDRCGICGKRVNGAVYPDPMSASLDHVVPLSHGGAHDPANVQLAHLACNLRKGNRGGGEQLRLCG